MGLVKSSLLQSASNDHCRLGSCLKAAGSVDEAIENNFKLSLTDRQMMLIRESWTNDFSTLYQLGSTIFTKLFQRNPATMKVFRSALKKSSNTELSDKDLHYFFLQFIQLITIAVANMRDTTVVLDSMLTEVGTLHRKLVPDGFKPEFFTGFPEATAQTIREYIRANLTGYSEELLDETCMAWLILCQYVVSRMQMGFNGH